MTRKGRPANLNRVFVCDYAKTEPSALRLDEFGDDPAMFAVLFGLGPREVLVVVIITAVVVYLLVRRRK